MAKSCRKFSFNLLLIDKKGHKGRTMYGNLPTNHKTLERCTCILKDVQFLKICKSYKAHIKLVATC